MIAPSSVRILVVDEEDRPVAQAQVTLWTRPWEPLDFGHLVTQSRTDATGSVVFRELEAGPYLLAVTQESGTRFRKGVRPLELHPEESRSVRLRFEDGTTLSGVVVDEADNPLTGVEVRVSPSSDWARSESFAAYSSFLRLGGEPRLTSSVHTGADGRFTVPHLLPLPHDVTCHGPGYTQLTVSSSDSVGEDLPEVVPESFSLGYLRVPPGTGDCRLVLAYRGSVSGRLARSDGAPITSFTIDGESHHHPQGAFTLHSRMTSRYDFVPALRIQAPGFVGLEKDAEEWGQDVDLGTLVLEEGRPVRVRVVDARSSLPLGGASLSFRDDLRDQSLGGTELGVAERVQLQTERDGTCLLPTVPGRPVSITVEHKDYREATAVLGPEEREVTLPLHARAILQGHVRVGGEPLPTGLVKVYSPGWLDRPGKVVELLEVHNGWYSSQALPPGRYILRAVGGGDWQSGPVFLPRAVEVPEEGTVSLDLDDVRGHTTLEVHVFEGLHRLSLVAGSCDQPLTADAYDDATELAHPADPPRALTAAERREEKETGKRPPRRDYRFRKLPAGRYTLLGVYGKSRGNLLLTLRQEVELPAEGTVTLELLPPPDPSPTG
jgi:hypothetical protein